MRRGELYTYVRPSTPTNRRTALILSGNDTIRPSRPWVLGLELRADDPEDLLAVPIGDGRFAYVGDLGRLFRAWCGRRVGRLDALTLARVDTALRRPRPLTMVAAVDPRADAPGPDETVGGAS